jgi:hypothetical protein
MNEDTAIVPGGASPVRTRLDDYVMFMGSGRA